MFKTKYFSSSWMIFHATFCDGKCHSYELICDGNERHHFWFTVFN